MVLESFWILVFRGCCFFAASFKAGSDYEFDLGWFSRVVTKDIRHEVPSAQDYRLIPRNETDVVESGHRA